MRAIMTVLISITATGPCHVSWLRHVWLETRLVYEARCRRRREDFMSLQGAGAALFALIPGRTALDWSQICMHGPPRCKAQNFDSICTFSTSIFVILAKPTTNAIPFVSSSSNHAKSNYPRWSGKITWVCVKG